MDEKNRCMVLEIDVGNNGTKTRIKTILIYKNKPDKIVINIFISFYMIMKYLNDFSFDMTWYYFKIT